MLIELVSNDTEQNSGSQFYLRNMMAVMAFDMECRGRLISQTELNTYMRWLAGTVTEAMHYFIGHDGYSPHTVCAITLCNWAICARTIAIRATTTCISPGYGYAHRDGLRAALGAAYFG